MSYLRDKIQKMITIVVGTNRQNSNSAKIAKYYKGILDSKFDGETQIVDLADLPGDFVSNLFMRIMGRILEVNVLREKVQNSEKLVFIVPEYNGSFPGVLKTFIDGLKYPEGVRDKKAGMIGVSSGVQGGVFAMSHLSDIFNYLGMHVLALKPKLAGIERILTGEKVTNDLYNQLLEQHAEKLVAF